ncbi:MAG TPA: peroxidase family protein [Bacteriovoracaceae bacterium]|nr:peroxidase family protein [Bacteriovoracaceae bacterium]
MSKKLVPIKVLGLILITASCAKNHPAKTSLDANRDPGSETGETPWTTWSKKGTVGGLMVLKKIRENLLVNNLHDPHINYSGHKTVDCSKINTNYRTADGTCNDTENPHVGAAGVAFSRNVGPEFIDPDAKEKLMSPNPGLVSKEFFTRDEFKPVPFLNMLAASWIQFMNHDWLSHGKNAEGNPHRVKVKGGPDAVIERTQDNPMNPGQYKKEFGKTTLNNVTHWWDGSQIYGSNQDEQNKVRSFVRGKMATVTVNGKELLPKDEQLNVGHNKQNHGHEVTGFRENWWVGLSMLHHLFVKEHNAIADMLYKKHVKVDPATKQLVWSEAGIRDRINVFSRNKSTKFLTEKELDEHVFQVARLINTAVMAKIHTIEWTPAILANKTLKMGMYSNWYGLANPQTWSPLKHLPGFNKTDWFSGISSGYLIGGIVGDKTDNYGVPFSISEEFTSVYRLHSLLPEDLHIRRFADKQKMTPVAFQATRNEKSYSMMADYELKDLFYSFGTQLPGQIVLNNFPKFMQHLEIPGHGKMDLGMVDIVRDRERGVPRYNQFRRAISLKPITRYSDFFLDGKVVTDRQKQVMEKLQRVYGKNADGDDNVEMIDLLVGTLAEEVRPENFGFGETQFQIFILMASRRLMADRFYTSNYRKEYYTKAGLDWIDAEGFLHKIIIRHMPELKPHLKGIETAFAPWNN